MMHYSVFIHRTKTDLNKTVLIFFLTLFLSGCKNKDNDIYGKYHISSEDPNQQLFIQGQDTYLQLNTDNTIVYNSTINNIQRFNFKGSFIRKNPNLIIISWQMGKLPDTLMIEQLNGKSAIKIGNTFYRK
ncbi:MAG TPA: hypothetical protein VF476_14755 [Chitinophagaceae bacterium]